MLQVWRQAPSCENNMNYLRVRAERRQIILKGISQNLRYGEIATQLGVRRSVLISDVKAMHRRRDPDLQDAQRLGQAKKSKEKQSASKRRDENFYNQTGMTFHEKSFQNMVYFFKHELMTILRSEDHKAAIRKLPKSTRRTMIHNGILTKRNSAEITQRAQDQLQQLR
jgi:hypothetical protein